MKERVTRVSFIGGLFDPSLYKRNQGRITRQVTFAALAIIVALGCYRLSIVSTDMGDVFRFLIPGVLCVAGFWISYRIVNMPRFADFLIAVEGEMTKVSWPNRAELVRSSIVVIATIFIMAVILFGYDLIWRFLLSLIDIKI